MTYALPKPATTLRLTSIPIMLQRQMPIPVSVLTPFYREHIKLLLHSRKNFMVTVATPRNPPLLKGLIQVNLTRLHQGITSVYSKPNLQR